MTDYRNLAHGFMRPGWARVLVASVVLLLTVGGALRPAAAQDTSIFPAATDVLALFEFDGSAEDSSGNNRNGELLGGTFEATTCGSGLHIAENTHGLDWSEYADEIEHPYTIEMILTPEQTSLYAKLFTHDINQDAGWYYRSEGISLYPDEQLGVGNVMAGELHYLAFVSTAANTIDVYFQGALLGSGDASFSAPPTHAIFFKDDDVTGNSESLRGVVEALRISSVARGADEIAAVQNRVENCAWQKVFLPVARR